MRRILVAEASLEELLEAASAGRPQGPGDPFARFVRRKLASNPIAAAAARDALALQWFVESWLADLVGDAEIDPQRARLRSEAAEGLNRIALSPALPTTARIALADRARRSVDGWFLCVMDAFEAVATARAVREGYKSPGQVVSATQSLRRLSAAACRATRAGPKRACVRRVARAALRILAAADRFARGAEGSHLVILVFDRDPAE